MTPEQITADAAGTWQLGDLTVRRIGFGAMRLTSTAGAFDQGPPTDRGRMIALLRRAVELGVNHIDTAAFYFSALRSANELINAALAPYPDDLVIVTKVGPGRHPNGGWLRWASPGHLRGQVEENLRMLGRDHLDVVNLRSFGAPSLAEHVGKLAELRDAGLIRHIGLSHVGPAQLAEAQTITPVVCVQNRYGLESTYPGSDDLLRICGEQGIAFVPFFAIAGQGRERGAGAAAARTDESSEAAGAAGATDAMHAALAAVARAHGVTVAQVKLAWTLHQGRHVLAIPGTGDPDHLAQNVAAGALRLSADELARLSAGRHEG